MAATRWQLRRNCSLTPRQAMAAWAIPIVALLGVALFSAAQGWWWVGLFALIDIAALVGALWLYARHALDGDSVLLDDEGMLHIEQWQGNSRHHTVWHASMVRLYAPAGEPITLRAGHARLEVGREAPPPVRDMTARELRRALRVE